MPLKQSFLFSLFISSSVQMHAFLFYTMDYNHSPSLFILMLTSPILKQTNTLSPYMMYSGGHSITSLIFLPRMHSLSLIRIHQTNPYNWLSSFKNVNIKKSPPTKRLNVVFWIKDDKIDMITKWSLWAWTRSWAKRLGGKMGIRVIFGTHDKTWTQVWIR